ncbi:hypothetical protein L485_22400 [Sphingobium baderi LL03]|uniref:Uncharacterized protein n=1 Tax=Sphingobium baderi LL03 TaxID=1114964 RepID=T0FZP6_9SPHN|nr:hypothetical protein L485_22400 [Sphingobium baderi LL03]
MSQKIIELIEAYAEANCDLASDQILLLDLPKGPPSPEEMPVINARMERSNYHAMKAKAATEIADLVSDLIAKAEGVGG